MTSYIFFRFKSKLLDSTVQAHALELDKTPNNSEDKQTDHDRLLFGAYNELYFPVIFKWDYGRKFCDILDTGWPSLYLISDHLKTSLINNKITGWETFKIKLLGKNNKTIDGYSGFSITGHCGPIDYSKSKPIYKRIFDEGPLWKYRKGYCFDINTWDGSDFFIPNKSFQILITEKTRNLLKEKKHTNISIEKIDNIEISEENIEFTEIN
jgi:hypothetical protein